MRINDNEVDIVLVTGAARIFVDLMLPRPMRFKIDGVGLDRDNAPIVGPIEGADRKIIGPCRANVDEYSSVPGAREESPPNDLVYVAFGSVFRVRHGSRLRSNGARQSLVEPHFAPAWPTTRRPMSPATRSNPPQQALPPPTDRAGAHPDPFPHQRAQPQG